VKQCQQPTSRSRATKQRFNDRATSYPSTQKTVHLSIPTRHVHQRRQLRGSIATTRDGEQSSSTFNTKSRSRETVPESTSPTFQRPASQRVEIWDCEHLCFFRIFLQYYSFLKSCRTNVSQTIDKVNQIWESGNITPSSNK